MRFLIIVAVDRKRGIGLEYRLPWKLKADIAWFKQATLGTQGSKPNAVIMGRKTWDSIPEKYRPLPNRLNIVLSKTPGNCSAEHCVTTFDRALALASEKAQEIFVIGGESIYTLALAHPALQALYITEIDQDFLCDVFFPDYSHLVLHSIIKKGQEGEYAYQIKKYVV